MSKIIGRVVYMSGSSVILYPPLLSVMSEMLSRNVKVHIYREKKTEQFDLPLD